MMKRTSWVDMVVTALLTVTPITIISLTALIRGVPKTYPDWVDYVIVWFVHIILFFVGYCARHHYEKFIKNTLD